jgi:hypothetical protein
MKKLRIFVVAAASLLLGAPLAAESDRRQPASKDVAAGKERAPLFGKPIEAKPETKDSQRSPWGGFYGGASGGSGAPDR